MKFNTEKFLKWFAIEVKFHSSRAFLTNEGTTSDLELAKLIEYSARILEFPENHVQNLLRRTHYSSECDEVFYGDRVLSELEHCGITGDDVYKYYVLQN